MTSYNFSQDELLAFARKIYEEGCYGYMDLKESVCDSLIREFIDGRQIVSQTDTNIMAATSISGQIEPVRVPIGSWDQTLAEIVATRTMTINGYNIGVDVGHTSRLPDQPLILSERDGPTWGVPQVRPEEYVRVEQNFQGNESERF